MPIYYYIIIYLIEWFSVVCSCPSCVHLETSNRNWLPSTWSFYVRMIGKCRVSSVRLWILVFRPWAPAPQSTTKKDERTKTSHIINDPCMHYARCTIGHTSSWASASNEHTEVRSAAFEGINKHRRELISLWHSHRTHTPPSPPSPPPPPPPEISNNIKRMTRDLTTIYNMDVIPCTRLYPNDKLSCQKRI